MTRYFRSDLYQQEVSYRLLVIHSEPIFTPSHTTRCSISGPMFVGSLIYPQDSFLCSLEWEPFLSAYFLAKTFFKDRRVGLLCALLAAVSHIHIVYSQEVRMYVLLLLLWPLFLVGLLDCWRTRYAPTSSLTMIMIFTVFAYTHGTAGLFALPLLVGCAILFATKAIKAKHRSKAVRAIVVAFCGFMMYLPWLARLMLLKDTEKQLREFGIHNVLPFFQWMLFRYKGLAEEQLLVGALVATVLLMFLFRWSHLLRRVFAPILPLVVTIFAVLVVQFLLCLVKPSLPRTKYRLLVATGPCVHQFPSGATD